MFGCYDDAGNRNILLSSDCSRGMNFNPDQICRDGNFGKAKSYFDESQVYQGYTSQDTTSNCLRNNVSYPMKECVVGCSSGKNAYDNLWGKFNYITNYFVNSDDNKPISTVNGKIYINDNSVPSKSSVQKLEIGNSDGVCYINDDKNNPYTGYINSLCNSRGILVSSNGKTVYGFTLYILDPCEIIIFDAINKSTIPIKDMIIEDDDYDPVADPKINFVFLGYDHRLGLNEPNSILQEKNRRANDCPRYTHRCKQVIY